MATKGGGILGIQEEGKISLSNSCCWLKSVFFQPANTHL